VNWQFLSLQGITAATAQGKKSCYVPTELISLLQKCIFEKSANLHDEILSGDESFFLQLKKEPIQNSLVEFY